MGRVIVVEIAKTQIRAASVAVSGLRASTSRQPAKLEGIDGLPRDLGEMILNRTLLPSIGELIHKVAESGSDEVEGIGIGISAAVEEESGIAHLTHQPGDVQEDFRETLEALADEFPNARERILLDNRTNLAAWGEYHLGWRPILDANAMDLLFITVSSSVGGGIISGGQLLRGVKGMAGQVGHLVLDPTSAKQCTICGQKGCASVLASGRSLVEYVLEHQNDYPGLDVILGHVTEKDGRSPMVDVGYRSNIEVNGTPTDINARAILNSVHEGSMLAKQAVDEMTSHLATLIEQLAYVLDPSIVILGGISAIRPELGPEVDERVHLRKYAAGGHHLRTSYRSDLAALYGAALRVCPPVPQIGGE